ncbi:MAG: asparagine synthase (glutamine-hydrolyzing) [Elusimicrobia bacterium RIFOXYA2_FULL_58_8]|nr:MAG: asparagine synthase (glutamine-hydrolyzing) [Elusimicrobia bacterium RIFOXYA12_FULL_57_11]OGS16142.1 MAG: asparagine synthase (glutamine-hydrolyzing) [Elusimicrobia bacterium RIFOXYA2_FULL_58_8]
MCGICGIYNYGSGLPVTREDLKAVNDRLVHRGPDAEGFYTRENIGLAMRRLSIIDLSTGAQPISNESGSAWIVFNGEIYNFQELRSELLSRGHKFTTKSDTETILHLYEEKGTDFPKYLRGMFAVAIWDVNSRRLVLARDRIGKKPLFYAITPYRLAFASELRALRAVKDLPAEINPAAIDAYLTLQYIPSPLSVFKGISKLEPASVLVFENGRVSVSKYWDLPVGGPKLSGADTGELKERLCAELSEAVRIRLMSEVPLGAFLSGGIDSSIVTALMARHSDVPVKTFSIGFKEEKFSELGYARQVAEMYGTRHTEFVVEAAMSDMLETLAGNYGEPYADPSALPSYFVSRETRRHVTVALNGDGGDEAFGGYLRYAAMKAERLVAGVPSCLKAAALAGIGGFPKTAPFDFFWRLEKFLKVSLMPDMESRYLSAMSFFNPAEASGLYSTSFLNLLGRDKGYALRYLSGFFAQTPGDDLVNRLIYTDLRSYLPECLMTKMDIASMANSLEARSPFLDHKVLEFGFSLPGNLKLKGLSGTKWILKETFKDMLPPDIYRRGKMGFGVPLGPWFRGELKDYWAGVCLSHKALRRGYFKSEELFRLWDEHQGGRLDHGYKLWALMMLELWHRQFADDYKVG